ncbi:glycosyltransferase [Deltaproteobacteria bacterium OttesenSCG-928-K17]|nr:glycosyltransferase [Deltaproteobacteria bacterium OttesenSCG-928-K17]
MDEARPRVLSVAAGWNASSGQLLKAPLDRLAASGRIEHIFRLSGQAGPADIEWADLAVFQNCQENIDIQTLNWLQRLGRPVIYQTDDYYPDIPSGLLKTRHFDYPHRKRNYETFLRRADLVFASTSVLAGALAPYTDRPIVAARVLPVAEVLLSRPPKYSNDGVFRFVYAASGANYRHLNNITSGAMRRLAAEYGPKVHFILMGGGAVEGLAESFFTTLPRLPLDEYFEVLSGLTVDAGLAPLDHSLFSLCKSDLKFREYGARGVAGLYSQTPVYAGSVVDGQTGLLIPNDEDSWHQAMKRAVDDPARFRAMGAAARVEVEARMSLSAYAEFWAGDIFPKVEGGLRARKSDAPPQRAGGLNEAAEMGPAFGPVQKAVYSFSLRLDQLWRKIRTVWYNAFYLDRYPEVTALKKTAAGFISLLWRKKC